MPTRQKVYARSIDRRLKREVKTHPNMVVFLSPYLTPHTAEAVICGATSEGSEIYTTFSAENFAVGASSIKTIRWLLESGFHVYHLPELHAKVVLTEEFASVGSQNLTAGGTRNREVSVVLSDKREVEYLRAQIAQWFGDRKLITHEMVEDMEAFIPSLRKKHREFKKAINAAELEIVEQQDLREAERLQEKKRKRREALRKRSQSLREAVQSKQVRASRIIYTQLVPRDNYDRYGDYQDSYSTLALKRQDESFLDWWIDDERCKLSKRYRYLLILLENGRLSWPAMNKTQITKYGTGLNMSTDPQKIGDHQYKLEYDLAIDEKNLLSWNVEVKIRPAPLYISHRGPALGQDPGVVVRGYFSLTGVTIVDLHCEPDAATGSPEITELYSRIERGSPEIQKLIKRDLLTPFKYEKNSGGIGVRDFFHGEGEHFQLQLRRLGDQKFLTAEKAI